MPTRHPSLSIIDSSKLSDYMMCPRYFFYRHVLGWRAQGAQFDLIFGEAMHKALEVLYRNGFGSQFTPEHNKLVTVLAYDSFLSIYREYFSEETDDDRANKNPYSAMEAIEGYIEHYNREFDNYEVLEVEGKKCVEVDGFVPISNETRLYFRQDAILQNRSTGQVFTLEHKTAGRGGHIWSSQWDLSLQVGAYTHALYSLFDPREVYGVRVNGLIFLKREVQFERVPCEKTYEQMNVWFQMVKSWLSQMNVDLHSYHYDGHDTEKVMKPFPLNPGNCTKWNRVCSYHDFCVSWTNPLQHCDEPPLGYITDHWDPRERRPKKEDSLSEPQQED